MQDPKQPIIDENIHRVFTLTERSYGGYGMFALSFKDKIREREYQLVPSESGGRIKTKQTSKLEYLFKTKTL